MARFAIFDQHKPSMLDPSKEIPSQIWQNTKDGKLSEWNHEFNIQNHVTTVLQDAIKFTENTKGMYFHLEHQFSVTMEQKKVSNSPHADIIFFQGGPRANVVGVCEVKKPSRDGRDLDDKKIFQLHGSSSRKS